MRVKELSLVFAAVTMLGCRDSTEPDSLSVTISAPAESQLLVEPAADGWPTAICVVPVTASISGRGSAEWGSATFTWFFGLNRGTPTQTETVEASEVRQGWDSPTLAPGQTQSASWVFRANYPFEVEMVFRFGASGTTPQRANVVRFACGPKPTTAQAPPTISRFVTPSGAVSPAGALLVEYAAASGMGMWATSVVTEGSFTKDTSFIEALQSSTERSVAVGVPPTAPINSTGAVSVLAVDPFGQSSFVSRGFGPVRDTTPPTFSILFTSAFTSGAQDLSGKFFIGESMHLIATASDNHRLSRFGWAIRPAMDSLEVPFNYPVMHRFDAVPVRREWLNGVSVHVFARDSSGLSTEKSFAPTPTFAVYETFSRPTASVALGADPVDEAFDAGRGLMYLLQPALQRVVVVSLADKIVVRTIALSKKATSVDVTPSGDSLVFALPDDKALGIVRLTEPSPELKVLPLTVLDTSKGQYPAVARAVRGGRVITGILNANGNEALPLVELELATGTQRLRSEGLGGFGLRWLHRSADHSTVVVGRWTCVQRFHVPTSSLSDCRVIGGSGQPSLSADGKILALGTALFDGSLTPIRQVETVGGGIEMNALIAPDGAMVYHEASPGLLRSRVSDGKLLDRTSTKNTFASPRMTISPDGRWLIRFPYPSANMTVSLIDLSVGTPVSPAEFGQPTLPLDRARTAGDAPDRTNAARRATPLRRVGPDPRGTSRVSPNTRRGPIR